MPMLSDPRHKAFLSGFVTSGNASAAYRDRQAMERNADVLAKQLMRTNAQKAAHRGRRGPGLDSWHFSEFRARNSSVLAFTPSFSLSR